MKTTYRKWLLELTSLPTAAGREDRVAAWVCKWAKSRRNVAVHADRFGNLILQKRGSRSSQPIFITAHMDHPSFVVRHAISPRTIEADFRGGVSDSYFVGAAVRLHAMAPAARGLTPRGVVKELLPADKKHLDKRAIIEFEEDVTATEGDVLMWDVGPARVEDDRLHSPACDDLAGVAAAICAFESWLQRSGRQKRGPRTDVRVLLTRSEEVGFVGAIAAAKGGTIPKRARVLALETSKSFAESPIGGGPIVRVGDRTSTFDPDLTYRVGKVAEKLATDDSKFKWQRKLMPGGTCEASAYQAYGYTATCLCLPLGNYHNMAEAAPGKGTTADAATASSAGVAIASCSPPGKIEAEIISLSDFEGLVRLLLAVAEQLDQPDGSPPLKKRLDRLFEQRKDLVEKDLAIA